MRLSKAGKVILFLSLAILWLLFGVDENVERSINYINYVQTNNAFFQNYEPVSSYKCLGKQNMISENDRRGCIFQNVCYRRSDKKFVYFNPNKRPVFYDKKLGPIFNFGSQFISLAPIFFFRNYFSPVVEYNLYPVSNDQTQKTAVELEQLHVFWTRIYFCI
jgi:hypothetical protein